MCIYPEGTRSTTGELGEFKGGSLKMAQRAKAPVVPVAITGTRDIFGNNIEWIKGLQCLKKCGMSLKDMRMYLDYCMQGPASIPERMNMLDHTKEDLERRLSEIQESLDYIEQKKELYRDMQEGKKPYVSYVYHVEN